MDLDINDLRSVMTVLSFLTFVGIVAWAWSARRKAAFDDAARLVFDEEDEAVLKRGHPAQRR